MLNLAFFFLVLFQLPDEVQIVPEPGGKLECVETPDVVCKSTGGVTVSYQDITVKAETITYNRTTGALDAGEQVTFVRGEEHLEGQTLSLDLQKKVGSLSKVSGYIGPGFFFSAARATRFEDGHYELEQATVTTCSGPDPGWSFYHGRVRVFPGRSVTAGATVFRLEGVPLFYMPYIFFPTADRERSSGFLIPQVTNSTTKGWSLRQPYYYAINRSVDATFTGQYFSRRGPAGEIAFRAVPNATSRLEVSASFVRDRLGQGGQSTRILNYTDLGDGFRGVADMNLVSSFVFRQVFEEGFSLISSPIGHRLAFLTRNQPGYSYNFLYNRSSIFFTNEPSVVTRKLPCRIKPQCPCDVYSQRQTSVMSNRSRTFSRMARSAS